MGYKIIASDLDKTLLGLDQRVSKENWKAIEDLCEKGVHFVPASGRTYEEMPTELLESPLIRYYITSNGTMVYDKAANKTYGLLMSRELGHYVLDTVYSYPTCLMIHGDNRSYVEERTHNPRDYAAFNMNEYWIAFAMDKETAVPNLREFAYGLPGIQAVIPFFQNKEDLKACKALLEKDSRLMVAQSDPHELEIFASEAGKGNALILLSDLLQIDRADTIAVGDSTNDRSMVEAAGLGLAMDNAVPELKAVADQVICHYTQHSAQYILEHFIA